MYKSAYLNRVLADVKAKNPNEKEFIAAVEEFFDSMDYVVDADPAIERNGIMERLVVPDRVISFRVSWVDDAGKVRVNNAWRVQFNGAIGPYKGGMRFAKGLTLSVLKFLGFEQTFKNSLTGLPMGGGKGGSDFDPYGKSDGEIMRFCQACMSELYRYLGPDTDVPAGDLGFGAREIGYMYGMYRKLRNEFTGVFTGKGAAYGGSLGRPEATGFGVLYFTEEMLKAYRNETIKGKRVIISGSGKVGGMAVLKAHELGAKIVAMSDIHGFIADPAGLDALFINECAKRHGEFTADYVKKYPTAHFVADPHGMWQVPCDIAIPCACQGEIHLDDAKTLVRNGCQMLVEGANMPTDVDAIRYLNSIDFLFSPGKASNAGGVAVSGLEMSQNAMHLSWTFEEVDAKLRGIMKNIFATCHATAKKYGHPTNLALGANIAGFLKVYQAMLAQGVI